MGTDRYPYRDRAEVKHKGYATWGAQSGARKDPKKGYLSRYPLDPKSGRGAKSGLGAKNPKIPRFSVREQLFGIRVKNGVKTAKTAKTPFLGFGNRGRRRIPEYRGPNIQRGIGKNRKYPFLHFCALCTQKVFVVLPDA